MRGIIYIYINDVEKYELTNPNFVNTSCDHSNIYTQIIYIVNDPVRVISTTPINISCTMKILKVKIRG